jgi:hypothetical protein
MGWVVNPMPRPLYPPGKRPGTHCTGGWLGARDGLDECGKISPPPGFDPRTVQPVTSRYTDYAIPAHTNGQKCTNYYYYYYYYYYLKVGKMSCNIHIMH